MTIQKTIIAIFAVLLLGAFTAITVPFVVKSESTSSACRVASTTRVKVGNQSSVMVVGTTTNRAYTRISQLDNATNTVSVSFSQGAAATLTTGQVLSIGAATGTQYTLEAGLNTDFPYTDAITAITDKGSTTVIVTNCTY